MLKTERTHYNCAYCNHWHTDSHFICLTVLDTDGEKRDLTLCKTQVEKDFLPRIRVDSETKLLFRLQGACVGVAIQTVILLIAKYLSM